MCVKFDVEIAQNEGPAPSGIAVNAGLPLLAFELVQTIPTLEGWERGTAVA